MQKLTLIVLCLALLAGASCTPANPTGGIVKCPRLPMPESFAHDTVVYRPDPAVPGDLLICALMFSSEIGEPGTDPYASTVPPANLPLVYRYHAESGALTLDTAAAWHNAGTPVGNLYSSLDFNPSLQLDQPRKVVVGAQYTTAFAGVFPTVPHSSPKDPSSGRAEDDAFGGKGSTHSALLTAARKDRPGILGSGGALRDPYCVQIFSVPDGAQIGPTRLLDEGEKAHYPPQCGWTYDGRYILCHHPGMIWIIPTPEVLESRAKKER